MFWGAQSYFGAVVSRQLSPVRSVLAMQAIGFVMLVPAALVLPGSFQLGSLVWGAVAGTTGLFGWVLMYAASSIGQIAVTQKISSGTAAIFPFVAGIVAGFAPGRATFAGFGMLLVSLYLLTAKPMAAPAPGALLHAKRAVVLSFGSGMGFGAALVALGHTDPGDGTYPFLVYRFVAGLALAALVLRRREALVPPKPLWGALLVSALFSSLGDVAVLWALQHGTYSLVPAITSMAPGVTAVLARCFRGEVLRRAHAFALVLGLCGVALLRG